MSKLVDYQLPHAFLINLKSKLKGTIGLSAPVPAKTPSSTGTLVEQEPHPSPTPQMPKVGERFLGTVVKTAPFGAFISLLPGKDG